jgi:hypothetical protein
MMDGINFREWELWRGTVHFLEGKGNRRIIMVDIFLKQKNGDTNSTDKSCTMTIGARQMLSLLGTLLLGNVHKNI